MIEPTEFEVSAFQKAWERERVRTDGMEVPRGTKTRAGLKAAREAREWQNARLIALAEGWADEVEQGCVLNSDDGQLLAAVLRKLAHG